MKWLDNFQSNRPLQLSFPPSYFENKRSDDSCCQRTACFPLIHNQLFSNDPHCLFSPKVRSNESIFPSFPGPLATYCLITPFSWNSSASSPLTRQRWKQRKLCDDVTLAALDWSGAGHLTQVGPIAALQGFIALGCVKPGCCQFRFSASFSRDQRSEERWSVRNKSRKSLHECVVGGAAAWKSRDEDVD